MGTLRPAVSVARASWKTIEQLEKAMRELHYLLMALVILLPALQGCPSPTIPRRSALVPRPTPPANLGGPIGQPGIKAFGHASSIGLQSQTQQPDDIDGFLLEGYGSIMLPRYQFGGGLYGAFNEYVEVGAQFSIAGYGSAEPNLTGGLEFPASLREETTFVGGPGVRANFPVPDTMFTPSLHLEMNIASVPQVTYVFDRNDVPPRDYTFESSENRFFLYPSLHASLTISLWDDYLHVYPFVGVQRGVRNRAFDEANETSDFDSLKGYLHYTGGLGVEGRYEFATLGATFFLPFGGPQEIDFGPSVSLTAGAIFR